MEILVKIITQVSKRFHPLNTIQMPRILVFLSLSRKLSSILNSNIKFFYKEIWIKTKLFLNLLNAIKIYLCLKVRYQEKEQKNNNK